MAPDSDPPATMPPAGSHSGAPEFIESWSWIILVASVALVAFGLLYGLRRWGDPPDSFEESMGQNQRMPYHTGRRGPRGSLGDLNQGASETHRLLEVREEDEEFDDMSTGGDGDSEITAVEGNLPASAETSDRPGTGPAAGRWKLKQTGFSTTWSEFKPKRGRAPRPGTRGAPRHASGSRSISIGIVDDDGRSLMSNLPSASNKDD